MGQLIYVMGNESRQRAPDCSLSASLPVCAFRMSYTVPSGFLCLGPRPWSPFVRQSLDTTVEVLSDALSSMDGHLGPLLFSLSF